MESNTPIGKKILNNTLQNSKKINAMVTNLCDEMKKERLLFSKNVHKDTTALSSSSFPYSNMSINIAKLLYLSDKSNDDSLSHHHANAACSIRKEDYVTLTKYFVSQHIKTSDSNYESKEDINLNSDIFETWSSIYSLSDVSYILHNFAEVNFYPGDHAFEIIEKILHTHLNLGASTAAKVNAKEIDIYRILHGYAKMKKVPSDTLLNSLCDHYTYGMKEKEELFESDTDFSNLKKRTKEGEYGINTKIQKQFQAFGVDIKKMST